MSGNDDWDDDLPDGRFACPSCAAISDTDEVMALGGRCPVCGDYDVEGDLGRHYGGLHTAADGKREPFNPLDDYYFPDYDYGSGVDGEIDDDDAAQVDMGNAWLIGEGSTRRKPHIQRGVEQGPAHPDAPLTDTERWLQNTGHEFAKRIHQAEPNTDHLYRGMTVPPEWVDKVRQDGLVTLPLSSFSVDPSLAYDYSRPDPGRTWSPRRGHSVILRVEPGSKSHPIADDEDVSHGDFDVLNIHSMTDDELRDEYEGSPKNHLPTTVLHVRQRSVPAPFDPHTAATDGIRYAHLVEADVAEDLQKLGHRTATVIHVSPEALAPHQQVDLSNPTIANDEGWAEGDEGWTVPDLMKSMKRSGGYRGAPITLLTNGKSGLIDDGHHRLDAARRLGLSTVPVQIQHVGLGQGPPLHPDLASLVHHHTARLAAVTQNLIDRLHNEFHQWWNDKQSADPDPASADYWKGNGVTHPIQSKEVAATMLMLHSLTHPGRSDWLNAVPVNTPEEKEDPNPEYLHRGIRVKGPVRIQQIQQLLRNGIGQHFTSDIQNAAAFGDPDNHDERNDYPGARNYPGPKNVGLVFTIKHPGQEHMTTNPDGDRVNDNYWDDEHEHTVARGTPLQVTHIHMKDGGGDWRPLTLPIDTRGHISSRADGGDRHIARTAGRNGEPPPMTFEPFNTMWTNGIMARHAADGRPIAHLHWYPDGEIETIRVHPQLRGRDIAKVITRHAAENPDTYPAEGGLKPSNHLTPEGRAFARSLGHDPDDAEVTPAEGEDEWAWKAIQRHVPMHIPYTGQNEDEMSRYLEQPWTPPAQKTSAAEDGSWPVWWRGRHRPAGFFDKRWHPNHPEHIPAPWGD